MTTPRVVFGLPAYNRPDSLPETLESILSQTYPHFAVVIVDDSTSPDTGEVVAEYAAQDSRIIYERNAVRLGMIDNWRRCFDRARALYPQSEYFAWISDHDVWHPRWLETLLQELDGHPDVVLAYPRALRTFEDRDPAVNRAFETFGLTRPQSRLQLCALRLNAGNLIYGLFRAEALARAGVFRRVLVPDRQVLLELSLLGQFKQVNKLLWYREIRSGFSFKRQRDALFAGKPPIYTYLSSNLTHAALLAWDLTIAGRGLPQVGRTAGIRYAMLQLMTSIYRDLRTSRRTVVEKIERRLRRGRVAATAASR
jgi:glycosyltransferase involved in cell wall biosynthesis